MLKLTMSKDPVRESKSSMGSSMNKKKKKQKYSNKNLSGYLKTNNIANVHGKKGKGLFNTQHIFVDESSIEYVNYNPDSL